jgi:hypothetical protein
MRALPTEVPAPEVFDVLKGALLSLEETAEPQAYQRGVLARTDLAEVLGFGLQFNQLREPEVAYGGEQAASYLHVSIDDGLPSGATGYQLSRSAYSILAQAPYHQLVPPHDRQEVEAFLAHYFAHHLGGQQ